MYRTFGKWKQMTRDWKVYKPVWWAWFLEGKKNGGADAIMIGHNLDQ